MNNQAAQHLALAERHVNEGKQHIADQEALIMRLATFSQVLEERQTHLQKLLAKQQAD